MSDKIILDTSFWIDYFGGTKRVEHSREVLTTGLAFTSIIAIAKLADKAARDDRPFEEHLHFIQTHSTILPISIEIALLAGKLKKKHRRSNNSFGLADAIHLATAGIHGAELITLDQDFKGIAGVRVI